MTDLNNWPDLVQVVKLRQRTLDDNRWQDLPDGTPVFSEYVQVPLNAYQMGNLLEALKMAEEDGDWHQELIAIIAYAMDKAGIIEVTSNQGSTFRLEMLRKGMLEE